MGFVKYSEEQLAERAGAQKAIMSARAHLKSIRDAKKAKKELIADVRRTSKARIRRIKEAEIAKKKENARYGPLLATLRKVYKPYMVARRKLNRLKVAKAKAELAAERKAAKEAAAEAKKQIELRKAEEFIAAHIQKARDAELQTRIDVELEIVEPAPKKKLVRRSPTRSSTKSKKTQNPLPAPICAEIRKCKIEEKIQIFSFIIFITHFPFSHSFLGCPYFARLHPNGPQQGETRPKPPQRLGCRLSIN